MREPGAWVEGHRGAVLVRGSRVQVSCTCGRLSSQALTVEGACLALVEHLQAAVRAGAKVFRGGDGDGTAGVREPRRPLAPTGSGSVELDIA